jgi:hypothetical protein
MLVLVGDLGGKILPVCRGTCIIKGINMAFPAGLYSNEGHGMMNWMDL